LLVFIVRRGLNGGPLILAYFLSMSLLHVPGAMSYIGAARDSEDYYIVLKGFSMLVLGLASLLAGVFLASASKKHPGKSAAVQETREFSRSTGPMLLIVGLASYFFIRPFAGFIPSSTSILSATANLVVLGLWVHFYRATQVKSAPDLAIGGVVLMGLPIATMVTSGFIGFGVGFIMAASALLYTISRQKIIIAVLAPFIVGLGLSFAVAYFGERNNLRESVWGGAGGFEQRLGNVRNMVDSFEWIDFNNEDHIKSLVVRLNESYLAGTGIARHEAGLVELTAGATIPLWVIVPRAIWPSKPVVGGSGNLVSEFTGIYFAEGTSVGVGQTLEFYMNFGTNGVVLGFFLLGLLIGKLDKDIIFCLRSGNLAGLLTAGLCGASLLQPNGNLMEIIVLFVASYIFSLGFNRVLVMMGVMDRDGFAKSARTLVHNSPSIK